MPVHHEQFRPVDVMRQQRGIRRAARQLGFVALGIDDIAVGAVFAENAAHIADVVQQAGDEKMGEIAGKGRLQQRACPS